MAETNGFTPVQKRMLEVLSDGQAHRRQELHACLPDELQPLSHIQAHISKMRKKLRAKGEDILCELRDRTIWYRHVRLLASPYRD